MDGFLMFVAFVCFIISLFTVKNHFSTAFIFALIGIALYFLGKHIKNENERIEAERIDREHEAALERIRQQEAERQIKENLKKELIAKESDLLSSIPKFNISISENKSPRLSIKPLGEIKYSPITSRTSFSQLSSFTVVDVETTGLNCSTDAIVEVSAIRFRAWEPIEQFSTLCNPCMQIPEKASNVNHITDDMVKDCPHVRFIIESLSSFIGSDNIVGHNLPFDLKFLMRNGYDPTVTKRKFYDTYDIAKSFLKSSYKSDNYDVIDFKLSTLCEYFKIPMASAHRSSGDALATGKLLKALAESKQ